MKKLITGNNQKLMRLKQIVAPQGIISVSKSTWYNWIKLGLAPKPMKLGKRVSVWSAEDIHKWIEKAQSNNANDNECTEYSTDKNGGGQNNVR